MGFPAVMSAIFRSLFLVLFSLLSAGAQTEMKKVVGDNATLPCHHQFPSSNSLDIEWLLQKPNSKQKVIITFFGGQVYTNEGSEASRLSFAGEYLAGDASLLISDLLLTDSGEYYCKVKTGGKYHWSQVNLIVLVKPSKPRCWMDGKLLEGSDVKMSCKSSDGSDPIHYKWERVLDKGKSLGKLPNLALIDLKNPELVTLRNLTMDSTGVYRCTASNDVGEENCTVEVTMQHAKDIGKVAGAVVGISLGVLIVILIIWLVKLATLWRPPADPHADSTLNTRRFHLSLQPAEQIQRRSYCYTEDMAFGHLIPQLRLEEPEEDGPFRSIPFRPFQHGHHQHRGKATSPCKDRKRHNSILHGLH